MSYEKNTWATGDILTAQKLNHMEDGIEVASAETPLIENREVIIPQTILNRDDFMGGPTSAIYRGTVPIPGTIEDFVGSLVPFDTYIVTIDGHEHYCIYDGGFAFCEPGLCIFMPVPVGASVGARAYISSEDAGEESTEITFAVISPRTGSTVTAKLEHATVILPAGLQPIRIFSGSADTQPK